MINFRFFLKFKILLIVCLFLFSNGQVHAFWWLVTGVLDGYIIAETVKHYDKESEKNKQNTLANKAVKSNSKLKVKDGIHCYVTVKTLNVRSTPSINGDVIKKVYKGNKLYIYKIKDKWVSVSEDDKQWVYIKYLSMPQPD